MSFCRGDYDGAVESISAIRAAADRCGGSVARCDLIHLTLLEAALRGHRKRLARTLAAERAVRKPRAASIAGSKHAPGLWVPLDWRRKRWASNLEIVGYH
jgi:hypothetical protein